MAKSLDALARDSFVNGQYVYFCHENHSKRARLYEESNNGTIIINKPFKKLWSLLINTKDMIFADPVDPVTINYPLVTKSYLESTPNRNNNFIEWRLIQGFNGPVVSAGYPIQFDERAIFYKIEWSSNKEIELEGFATYDNLNGSLTYPMFDSKYNFVRQSGRKGTFIFRDYSYIYIRTNIPSDVKLSVEIIKTPVPPIELPEIQYLYFKYESQLYRFPVLYNKNNSEPGSNVDVIVDQQLIPIQTKILFTMNYYATPWPKNEPNNSRNIVNLISDPNVFGYVNQTGRANIFINEFYMNTYTNTTNYEDFVVPTAFYKETIMYGYTGVTVNRSEGTTTNQRQPWTGVNFSPQLKENAQVRIRFTITLRSFGPIPESALACVGYKKWGTFSDYTTYDGTIPYELNFNNVGDTRSGFIDLPIGTTGCTLWINSILFTDIAPAINPLVEYFSFDTLTLEYI